MPGAPQRRVVTQDVPLVFREKTAFQLPDFDVFLPPQRGCLKQSYHKHNEGLYCLVREEGKQWSVCLTVQEHWQCETVFTHGCGELRLPTDPRFCG
jgi:hypothetical protein